MATIGFRPHGLVFMVNSCYDDARHWGVAALLLEAHVNTLASSLAWHAQHIAWQDL